MVSSEGFHGDLDIKLSTKKMYLSKKNYEVHTANSLNEGLEKLQAMQPDSLLLDNNLPDGMGWKMAWNLKEKFPQMQITLVSSHHDAEVFKTNLGNEFTILEKPLSLTSIEQYL